MSDTDDDGGLGRREVLAAVAGAGGLGLAGGVGTAALLGDSESFDGMFQSGSLNLEVVDKDETESQVDGDTLELNLDLESSREGSEVLKLWAPPGDGNNPAYVWFQPTCPDPVTRLAEQLEVAFYYADSDGDRLEDDNGDEIPPIESGSLTDVANALRKEGALLDLGEDDSCLAPGSPAYLRVEWDLADSYSAGEKLDFSIVFRARQCRNNSRTKSPFNQLDSCEPAPCPCCQLVGKLELGGSDDNDSYVEPGQYAFTEGSDDYELVVANDPAPETKDSGAETVAVSVDVVGVGNTPDPELCEVVIKAGGNPNNGDDRVSYTDDELNGDGTATPLLDSVPKTDSPSKNGDYYGISSITVGICAVKQNSSCPDDLVSPTSNAGGDS